MAIESISHYRIIRKLGAGGMGEVYLARDTRLDRKMALKLLPQRFTQDQDRLRRFAQEARAASALNHPNIITIHDIGKHDSTHFIATEYVEGGTLRDLLRHTRIDLTQALDIASQIASALVAAHRAGIVHRDIKPENVMLRPDRIVKVLDFGLAKLTDHNPSTIDSEAPTMANANTEPGKILGTVNYMSPEQARGKPLDARSDLFSLGVVIYEMVAGYAPFEGETASDLIAAILKSEPPPLVRHSPDVPPELERIVAKALSKDREERYQTAKDLLIDLKHLRRQIEVDAEVERSISPASTKPPLATGGSAQATASDAVVESGQTTVRPTSSVEYIITGITEHTKVATAGLILLLVLGIGFYVLLRPSVASKETNLPTSSIGSLAVLPFVNESDNSDVEYLSDGMTESLINSLSRLANLSVKARSTVFRYKGKNLDPLRVGGELKVQAVLNGRVMQRGEQLTLGLELVEVRTGNQLWGEQYNRKLSDLVLLQSEIARDVSDKLRLKLSRADEQKVTRSYTANPEAYQLYLRGRFHRDKYTPAGLQKAVDYFQQAIAADSGYALAYARLADSYAVLSHFHQLSPQELMPKAKEAALKGQSLDNNLAEAHTALGLVLQAYDYDFAGAEREHKRALELNPEYGPAHLYYGDYLANVGRFEQAIAEFQRSLELEPVSLPNNWEYRECLFLARRYDEAIAQGKKTIELDANFLSLHFGLAYAYWGKGMHREGVEEWIGGLEAAGGPQLAALLRERFAKGGMEEFRRAMVGKFGPYSAFFEAQNLAQMGEKDRAFEELNRAYENRENNITTLKVDPFLDPLRNDPRFKTLLARVGFSQ